MTANGADLPATPPTSLLGPAIRLWVRNLIPLTALSALALSPVLAVAQLTRAPTDRASALAAANTGWVLVALAVFGQLILTGAASAMITAPSRLRALPRGLAQLARAIVPCLAAVVAIALGGLALAVPGAILLVLLALTGASRARGVTAALTESMTAARAQWIAVALIIAGAIALDIAIRMSAYGALVGPLPRQPTPAQLAAIRQYLQVTAVELVVFSPLVASLLAVVRHRADRLHSS